MPTRPSKLWASLGGGLDDSHFIDVSAELREVKYTRAALLCNSSPGHPGAWTLSQDSKVVPCKRSLTSDPEGPRNPGSKLTYQPSALFHLPEPLCEPGQCQ